MTVESRNSKREGAVEKKRERRIISQGKHLRFVDRGGWEYVERVRTSGIVVLVATTEADEMLFVEQYRPAVDARVIELPAGLVGDEPGAEDEDMEDAARRELLEETGYEAGELEYLTEGSISSGLSAEVITLYLARGVRKVASGGGDESEDITSYAVALVEVEAWLRERKREGAMIDTKVWTGLYFAKR